MSFVTPPATTTTPVWANLVGLYLVPLITVIGMIVLLAIGKIDSQTAVPIIALIAGVHAGAALTPSSTTPTS